MLKFLTRAGRDDVPGLATVEGAEALWRALPSDDPIASQVALYRYEAWPRGRWKELNGAYEFALTHDLARQPVGADRRNGETVKTITLEQTFMRILLLQLMDSGQFLPSDIAVARQWIARWCELSSLKPIDPHDGMLSSTDGFVVSLAGYEGVKRLASSHAAAGAYLRL